MCQIAEATAQALPVLLQAALPQDILLHPGPEIALSCGSWKHMCLSCRASRLLWEGSQQGCQVSGGLPGRAGTLWVSYIDPKHNLLHLW